MGVIDVARADNAHQRRIDAQLLVRLAQRGFLRRFARIDAAAGKGDLPRMRAHVRWPVEQQHARLRALGEGHQHGGAAEFDRLAGQSLVAEQRRGLAIVAALIEPAQVLEQIAHCGTSE